MPLSWSVNFCFISQPAGFFIVSNINTSVPVYKFRKWPVSCPVCKRLRCPQFGVKSSSAVFLLLIKCRLLVRSCAQCRCGVWRFSTRCPLEYSFKTQSNACVCLKQPQLSFTIILKQQRAFFTNTDGLVYVQSILERLKPRCLHAKQK